MTLKIGSSDRIELVPARPPEAAILKLNNVGAFHLRNITVIFFNFKRIFPDPSHMEGTSIKNTSSGGK